MTKWRVNPEDWAFPGMSKVRDKVTGIEGKVTGMCLYLNGCVQILMEYTDKEGAPKSWWIDIGRLEAIDTVGAESGMAAEIPPAETSEEACVPGGPTDSAPRIGGPRGSD